MCISKHTLKAQLKEELMNEMKNDHDEPLDNLWMLIGGVLVFFMHTGFSDEHISLSSKRYPSHHRDLGHSPHSSQLHESN